MKPRNLYFISILFTFSTACNSIAPAPLPQKLGSCNKTVIDAYVSDVDEVMEQIENNVLKIQGTESPEEMNQIADEFSDLFIEVSLWEVPECAMEVQVNLLGAISNLDSAIRAVANSDMEDFERQYGTYTIFMEQLNIEVEKLLRASK